MVHEYFCWKFPPRVGWGGRGGGKGVVLIRAYTVRLHPKEAPFSGFRCMKAIEISLVEVHVYERIGFEIFHFGLTDAFYGCEKVNETLLIL